MLFCDGKVGEGTQEAEEGAIICMHLGVSRRCEAEKAAAWLVRPPEEGDK